MKDLSRKYWGNYYDCYPSTLMLTAQRMFVLHGGGWKRARIFRLTSLWFMISHSKPHPRSPESKIYRHSTIYLTLIYV